MKIQVAILQFDVKTGNVEHNMQKAEQMMVNTTYEGLPINIILDGKLIPENLNGAKLTPEKVNKKLKEMKLKLEDVFYASIDATGEFFIQEREVKK